MGSGGTTQSTDQAENESLTFSGKREIAFLELVAKYDEEVR